jgi:hypothetical protein
MQGLLNKDKELEYFFLVSNSLILVTEDVSKHFFIFLKEYNGSVMPPKLLKLR